MAAYQRNLVMWRYKAAAAASVGENRNQWKALGAKSAEIQSEMAQMASKAAAGVKISWRKKSQLMAMSTINGSSA